MSVALSPLRISLGGGGTDMPSFYQHFGAFFISAAIDLTVKVSIKRTKSEQEHESPFIREVIKHYGNLGYHYVINSCSKVLPGSGLGGSASFTTALLKALGNCEGKVPLSKEELAEAAFSIEHDKLGLSCGKQDQYSAAFGGLRSYEIDTTGKVSSRELAISDGFLKELQERLVLVASGTTRSSEVLLKEQLVKSTQNNPEMINNLLRVKEMGQASFNALSAEEFVSFAMLVKEHWQIKEERSKNMYSKRVKELHDFGLCHGALSGKLIGAGRGGYLLFCIDNQQKLFSALREQHLDFYPVTFDFLGTRTV